MRTPAARPLQGLLWDLGGVLLRTEDPGPRQRLAARFGLTRAQLEDLVFNSPTGLAAQRGEISARDHLAAVARQLGLDATAWREFWQQFWAGDQVDAHLVAWLRARKPRYRLGLLSNAWDTTRAWLARQPALAALWDVVVISAEVGRLKPDPAIYRHALAQMDLPPAAVLFVDDQPANVAAARALGLVAIPFTGRAALSHALAALGLPPL